MKRKQIKWLAALLACGMLLCSCEKTSVEGNETMDVNTTASTTEGASVSETVTTEPIPSDNMIVHIVENGNTTYKVVRSDDASEEISTAAVYLRKAINTATGANVGIASDLAKENTKEILVGNTIREESKEFQATLTGYSFGIKITEDKIIIAATHEDFIPLAVDYFMEKYLVSGEYVEIGEGTFSLSSAAGVICSGELADLTNIRLDTHYATISELYGQIDKNGNFKIMQGGCVTDKYAYMAVINTADYDEKAAGVYIYKYDLANWKLVKRSKVLMLDHANDITYNPENNMLYVSHCYVDSKKISLIDADTLELVTSIWSDNYGLYAFDYIEEKNIFVGGNSKSSTILFKGSLNGEKLITSGRIQGITTTLVTQGICADSNYVYHVMFSSNNASEPYNAIFIYDLNTKTLAHNVRLSISGQEPENISLVNGAFYIGCNSSTTKLDVYKSVLYEFDFDACVPCP